MTTLNNIFNIKEAMSELQGLGVCLRIAVHRLPNSAVKQYLLYAVTKPIEINSFADFQKMQDRVSGMLDIVIQEDQSGYGDYKEVLELLNAMKKDIAKIANHTETEGEI